jgi:thioredoxin-related protein
MLTTVGHIASIIVLVLLIASFLILNSKTREAFDEQRKKYSVMFFYQEGCGHCHELLSPTGPLAVVAKKMKAFLGKEGDGKNCVVAIDFPEAIDVALPKNKELGAKYAVSYTPFVVLVDADGAKISELTGPKTCEGIAKWINTNITCIPQTLCA